MLIAIEGIDGAGKGTQARQLLERVRKLGYSAKLVAFPRYEDTHSSRMVAAYLNGEFGSLREVPPAFAATLFALDRMESRSHLEEMQNNHELVIVDRYVSSNLAYQSARISIPERTVFAEWLLDLEYGVYGLPKPDLTFFLDIPAVTSKKMVALKETRAYTKDVHDLHEQNSTYLSNVRKVYHWLISLHILDPCCIIQCHNNGGALREIDNIGQEICDLVVRQINTHEGICAEN
ncbi:MAG: dTMP kinase [Bacteroidetes bacterium]|nr:dTMP kinase [Bacteroidota bacterium]MCY4205361.1 dTMP kinase [Bacteroidota bacterium]